MAFDITTAKPATEGGFDIATAAPAVPRPEFVYTDPSAEVGPVESFFVSAGKGMYDIARGIGLVEMPDPTEAQAYQALEEARPYTTMAGEITGQAAPFLLPGTAVSQLATMPARVGAMTGLGAAEAGIIARGTGGTLEDITQAGGVGGAIAGTAEAVFPVLGRISRQIYSRIKGKAPEGSLIAPDGKPTKEMAEALDAAGLQWEDLKIQAQDLIAQQRIGADPEEVARLAGFEQIGAPALRGQVTKEFAQRKQEQQLLEAATEAAGEPVRQTALRQSEAIRTELDDIVESMGVTGDTGAAVKEALQQRRKTLKADRKDLYNQLAGQAKTVDRVPVITEPLLDALPERGIMRDIAGVSPNQFRALNDLLVEFGIEQGQEAVEEAARRGIRPQPLGLNNFESFRKRLGIIERTDQTGAISNIIGPLRRALDDEIDLAARELSGAGGEIAETAKAARQAHIALKTEFDDKKITSKLIDSVKRGSTQPKIEGSKVYQKIMNPNEPIENLERVLASLKKEGPNGHRAIREIQGRAVMDLLDSAFSAQSQQIAGQRVFGATPYSKQYEKLLPKLEVLFKGDPKSFKRIQNIYNRAQDIIPPGGAIPKGSAGFFIDALNQMGLYSVAAKVPFARELFEIAKSAGVSATARREAERAINAKPSIKGVAYMIDRDYPQIATALGIAGISTKEEEE